MYQIKDLLILSSLLFSIGCSSSNDNSNISGDIDSDSVADGMDNCPQIFNPDQSAIIGNTFLLGDLCDDEDSDSVVDAIDNCPLTGNSSQADVDGNGVGDACEALTVVPSDIDFFKEVALNVEFGSGSGTIRKWLSDIRYFVSGDVNAELTAELDRVVNELNLLIDIKLIQVFSEADANFEIYFGSGEYYASTIEANALGLVDSNDGLFWNYWNADFEMVGGSMYIETVDVTDLQLQKHLIREELTQSIGIFNDSFSYPDSIFYAGFSKTTEYAPIDREVILFLYSNSLSAGMREEEVNRALGLI